MVSMKERIEKKLRERFSVKHLLVENQSGMHRGHAGDDGSGESHFLIEIEAEELYCLPSRLERYRMIHAALADELRVIHALSIRVCNKKK